MCGQPSKLVMRDSTEFLRPRLLLQDVAQILERFPSAGDELGDSPGHGESGVRSHVLAGLVVLADPQLDGGHAGQAQYPARDNQGSAAGQAVSPPARRDPVNQFNDPLATVSEPDDADEPRLFGDGDYK